MLVQNVAEVLNFEKERMMRGTSIINRVILSVLLCVMVLGLCGCWEQMGETAAEGSRRHQRNLRIDGQGLAADIDMFWLLDEPSTLTERRIP